MERINGLIKEHSIEFVRLEVEDIHGISRGFTLDVDYFKKTTDTGVALTKSINATTINGKDFVSGTGCSGEIDYSCAYAYPDLETFCVLPWLQHNASVLAHFREKQEDEDSNLVNQSTRAICHLQLERLRQQGMRLYSAFEYEFYLLDENKNIPKDDYSLVSNSLMTKYSSVTQNIMCNMKMMGIPCERSHSEYGPTQFEISQVPAYDMKGIDNGFRFKHYAKEMIKNYTLTFLSKPFSNYPGSSGHFNHSLWNQDSHGENLMYDDTGRYGLSELGESWIAGLMYHSKPLSALMCPTTNCFSRNVCEHMCTPINNLWGLENKTVSYRVKVCRAATTYVENRIPGGSSNPYLVAAGTIIAGLDGVEKNMKLTVPPFAHDIFKTTEKLPDGVINLPGTLFEALKDLEGSDVFLKELGEEFVKCFTTVKRHELNSLKGLRHKWFRDNVTAYI